MGHYKSNLRDIEFNLFEVLGRQDILGKRPFDEVDEDTARDMLAEVNRLAVGPLAEPFADADRNPPAFDPATGTVTMPESFRKAYQALVHAGWLRPHVPPETGGTPRPESLDWAGAGLFVRLGLSGSSSPAGKRTRARSSSRRSLASTASRRSRTASA